MADFLPTDELDFDSLRNNLKEFLSSQDIFKDYNFEGSNIAVLLSLLGYNTYQNAYLLNMIGSEMFMDTAELRDSIVSHAKELNYLPRSYTSATAGIQVNINVTSNTVHSVTIPQGFKFLSTSANGSFIFSTGEPYVVERNANNQFIANIDIHEGFLLTEKYIANTSINGQRFVISNDRIDINSLEVLVAPTVLEQENATEYLFTTSIYSLNGNSEVFYLQACENNKYEIIFGDNVFGKTPENGNIIIANYRISSGNTVNGVSNFTAQATVDGYTISTTTLSNADGGAERETNESIKFNAPRYFQTQDRLVNKNDYKALLTANFPEIKYVNVYGGEELTPIPQYGKVVISAVTQTGDPITQSTTDRMITFINQRNTLGIKPMIVEPEFLELIVRTEVTFNSNKTTLNNNQVRQKVISAINGFNSNNLMDFGKIFRFSKLTESINECDKSVLGNETSILLKKTVVPLLNENFTATIEFNNAFQRDDYNVSRAKTNAFTVYSSQVTYNSKTAFFGEDGAGKLIIFERTNTGRNILVPKAGIVNYETGMITIDNVVINDYIGDGIIFYAIPRNQDIYSFKNTVIKISDVNNNITVKAVKE